MRQISTLKRTDTKTEEGSRDKDLAAVQKVYDDNGGDLPKIAKAYGIPEEVLTSSPPNDAADFAKKLLEGGYNTDTFEVAKLNLRGVLKKELDLTRSSLRKSITNEWTGYNNDELAIVGKLFTKHRGNLDAIATDTGLSVELLRKHQADDATDFAKKLLSGVYTSDKSAVARQALRDKLKTSLGEAAAALRRTTTKEWNGSAAETDIGLFSTLYAEHAGDLDKIAKMFGLNRKVFEEDPPTDGNDFARKLLLGKYTQDLHLAAAKDLRVTLTETLVDGATPQLKRTNTKEYDGIPDPADIVMIARVYNQYSGNLDQLSTFFSANAELVYRLYPTSANDFAQKLLAGQYSDATSDDFRKKLRTLLRNDLKTSKGRLRRIEESTREGAVEPDEDSVARWAIIWEEQDGVPEAVASLSGCNVHKLREKPPADARTFGRNFLLGVYSD